MLAQRVRKRVRLRNTDKVFVLQTELDRCDQSIDSYLMTLGHQPTSAFHENKVPRNRLRTALVVKHLAGCLTHTQFSNNGSCYSDFSYYCYDCYYYWAKTVTDNCFCLITHHQPLAKSYLLKMPERWLIMLSCYLLGRFQKEDIWVGMLEVCKELQKCTCCYWQ